MPKAMQASCWRQQACLALQPGLAFQSSAGDAEKQLMKSQVAEGVVDFKFRLRTEQMRAYL